MQASTSIRSELRRAGRPDAQLRGAVVRQRRVAQQREVGGEPEGRGEAGLAQDEAACGPRFSSGRAAAARTSVAQTAARTRLHRQRRQRDRARRARSARAAGRREFRIGDVDGECRDRQPVGGYGRRPRAFHARESREQAASRDRARRNAPLALRDLRRRSALSRFITRCPARPRSATKAPRTIRAFAASTARRASSSSSMDAASTARVRSRSAFRRARRSKRAARSRGCMDCSDARRSSRSSLPT